MKTEREQFEARFPVPDGVAYSARHDRYLAVRPCTDARVEVADLYDDRWETWQAAREGAIVLPIKRLVEAIADSFGFHGHQCITLVPLRSMNLKICADCGKEHPWELAPGQQPLIGNNRADRRAAE